MKGSAMQLPGATTPVSPKVLSGANWSGYAILISTLANAVSPDMLKFLGPFEPLAYGLVVLVAYAAGSYLKGDPLRDAGLAALAAAAKAAADEAAKNAVTVPSAPAVTTVNVTTVAPADAPAAPPAGQ